VTTSASRAQESARAGRPPAPASWFRNAWMAIFVAAVALAVGTQLAAPNRRTLQVIAAGMLGLVALRVSSFTSLLLLVVAVPFPKPTSYGGTTLAFVLLVFILWVARLTLRIEKPAGRSSIDLPVVLLILAYLLGFSQFDDPSQISPGLINFFYTLTNIFLGYLVIHLTRTEKQLRQLIAAIVVMAVLVQLTAVFELMFPDRALVPGWIELGSGRALEYLRQGLEITNLRVGSTFQDYELLSEFTAMMVLLLWFVLMRTRGTWARTGVVALLVLDTFVLLATVTRGALVSLAVAGAYLAWRGRQRIRFHVFVIGLVLVVGTGAVVLDFVAHHTRSGNVAERMEKTKFEGAIPENRVLVWVEAWDRIMKRPLTGYGPYYGKREGVKQVYWPHNNYLFYWHMLGIGGLAAFLWLLWRLWRETRYTGPHLGHPAYATNLLLALRAMLILFVVDQIKIDYLRQATYAYWVWMFFALIVVTGRLAKEEAPALAAGAEATASGGSPRRLPAVSSVSAV
jgi:hypothetical protein